MIIVVSNRILLKLLTSSNLKISLLSKNKDKLIVTISEKRFVAYVVKGVAASQLWFRLDVFNLFLVKLWRHYIKAGIHHSQSKIILLIQKLIKSCLSYNSPFNNSNFILDVLKCVQNFVLICLPQLTVRSLIISIFINYSHWTIYIVFLVGKYLWVLVINS